MLSHPKIALTGCIAFTLGATWWLIAQYGQPHPFVDQWGSEGWLLLKPYVEGTLSFKSLFAHHNEHRIFFTRLLVLGLFAATGTWDLVLEMIVNAIVHAAALTVLILVLIKGLDTSRALVLMVFATLLHAIPFGWENALWGFQSQTYFVFLFGTLSLSSLLGASAWSARWWCGAALGIAAYFSAAAGLTVLATATIIYLLQIISGARCGRREILATVALAFAATAMALDIPIVAEAEPLRAHTIREFVNAALTAASWPLSGLSIGRSSEVYIRSLAVLILNIPLALTAVSIARDRPPTEDRRWLLLALGFWVAVQMCVLAYARATGIMAFRYVDIFLMGLIVNCACLLALTHASWISTARSQWAVLLWLGVVLVALHRDMLGIFPVELEPRKIAAQIQGKNVRAFLDTGALPPGTDVAALPYPSVEWLTTVLSDPVMRSILPPTIGERTQTRNYLAFRYGKYLMPIGLAFLLTAMAMTQPGFSR